jgi:hypothetical protein
MPFVRNGILRKFKKRVTVGKRLLGKGPISEDECLLLVAACSGGVWFSSRFVLRGEFVAMNRIENFAPVDRYFLRGLNPKADFVSSNFDNHDRNVIVDDNTFVLLARKH